MTIEEAAKDFDLPTPRQSSIKKWGYFQSLTDGAFDLWLHDDCSYIDSYVQEADLNPSSPDSETYAHEFGHGWKLDPDATTLYVDGLTKFAISRAASGACDFYLTTSA